MAQSKNIKLHANWQPFCLGATPFADSAKAWRSLNQRFDRLVGWPQLVRRSRFEGLYIQFSQGFPGLVCHNDILWVDPRRDYEHDLQALYLAYLEGDSQHGRIEPAYAQGLADLLAGRVFCMTGCSRTPLPSTCISRRDGRTSNCGDWGIPPS